ncbi:MAG: prephenate dehydrogenase/arogenate dehydrogenase family protein [Acidimicrobiia bacterium]
MSKPARRIAIIGTGLVGGSLALRLQHDPGWEVATFDSDPNTRAAARGAGLAVCDEPAHAMAGADLVVFAIPSEAFADAFGAVAHRIPRSAVVTSCAPNSYSASVFVHALQRVHPELSFVSGTPMVGHPQAGFRAATPTLFADACWIIGEPNSDAYAFGRVAEMAHAVGAHSVAGELTASERDVVAATLVAAPQVVAACAAANMQMRTRAPLEPELFAHAFRYATSMLEMGAELAQQQPRFTATVVRDAWRKIETLQFAFGRIGELERCLETVDHAYSPLAARFPNRDLDPHPDARIDINRIEVGLLGYAVLRAAHELVGATLPSGRPVLSLAGPQFSALAAHAHVGLERLLEAFRARDNETLARYTRACQFAALDLRRAERVLFDVMRTSRRELYVFGVGGLQSVVDATNPAIVGCVSEARCAYEQAAIGTNGLVR